MLTRLEIEKIKAEFGSRLAALNDRLLRIDSKTEKRLTRQLTGETRKAAKTEKSSKKLNKKLSEAMQNLGFDPALLTHLQKQGMPKP